MPQTPAQEIAANSFTPSGATLSIVPPEGTGSPVEGFLVITRPYDAIHRVL
jgi:hypothetical protein